MPIARVPINSAQITVCRLPVLIVALAAMLLAGSRADAQLYEVKPSRNDPNYRRRPATNPNATPPGGVETRVNVEIFAGAENAGFEATSLGVDLRAGRRLPADPLRDARRQAVDARKTARQAPRSDARRPARTDGSLTFETRKFKAGESSAVLEWLNEIRTYGARGEPPRQGASGD